MSVEEIVDGEYVVVDVAKSIRDRKFLKGEDALKWISHLTEWYPNARPVLKQKEELSDELGK